MEDTLIIRELVEESDESAIYLLDSPSGKQIAAKVLHEENPPEILVRRLQSEFTCLSALKLPGLREVILLGKVNNRPALIFYYCPGKTLQYWCDSAPFSTRQFLQTATAMVKILASVHDGGYVHHDINSYNWILSEDFRSVELIDFDSSGPIEINLRASDQRDTGVAHLAYVSPEKTGRMNRQVDYRTDLYSLGVVFYQMLTGKRPFAGNTALEMIRSHLILTPTPLHTIRADIPQQLSDIIALLLQKNAEHRYQSCHGLHSDLSECLLRYQQSGAISSFALRQQDFTGRLQISQRIYGREAEVNALVQGFESIIKGGVVRTLVSGYSGTGKSTLINEVRKTISLRDGFFIEGKFDQYQNALPYEGLILPIRHWVSLLLTYPDNVLATYSRLVSEALGHDGKILTDVIPELETLIGPQLPVNTLDGIKAQHRLDYLFGRLFQAISTAEHPLVLFIDDCQWADRASLRILQSMLTDTALDHFLCICAYRDNEVDETHPFMVCIDNVKTMGMPIRSITLGNLTLYDIQQLVGDTLQTPYDSPEAIALSQTLIDKTQGNPFFVKQFITALYTDGLIVHNRKTNTWEWDLQKIAERRMTDNVIELMTYKVDKLQLTTQKMLQSAACIGNRFDPEMLRILHQDIEPSVQYAHWQEALKAGLLESDDAIYHFVHDRIQQAVYQMIPPNALAAKHLEIGRLMLHTPDTFHVFDITNQWNHGIELLESTEEKVFLAKLNLESGKKAKAASAYNDALFYFDHALRLLQPDGWPLHYALCLETWTEAADTTLLAGEFDQMELLVQTIREQATNAHDRVAATEILIKGLIARNVLTDAILVGRKMLHELGLGLPANPQFRHIVVGLLKSKIALAGKRFDHLRELPPMQDETAYAQLRLISEIAPAAYWVLPNLLPLLVFKMVRLSIAHGNTKESVFAYATYGMILCELGEISKGYRFGELSESLLGGHAFQSVECRTRFVQYCFINHWTDPLSSTIEPFYQNYLSGLETGDHEYGPLSYYFSCQHAFYSGEVLPEVERRMQVCQKTIVKLKQETALHYLNMHYQAVINLQRDSADTAVILDGEAYAASVSLEKHRAANDKTAIFKFHFVQLFLHVLFMRTDHLQEHIEGAAQHLDGATALHVKALFFFYAGIGRIHLYESAPGTPHPRADVRKYLKKLKDFSRHAPENFSHCHTLLNAEYRRISGQTTDLLQAYQIGIDAARKNGILHAQALGLELLGSYLYRSGQNDLAEFYLAKAYQTWTQWGALSIAKELQQRYMMFRFVRQKGNLSIKPDFVRSHSLALAEESIDLSTLIHASTIISDKIILRDLLHTLLKLVMDNAGAQTAILTLQSDGEMYVEATGSSEDAHIEVLQHTPLDAFSELPHSLLNYVARVKESVVIKDSTQDPQFMRDAYFQEKKALSAMALPIVYQGSVEGVFYLENRLTTEAFTRERTQLLKVLIGQIAVAIRNARLYADLAQSNARLELTVKRFKQFVPQGVAESSIESSEDLLLRGEKHHVAAMFCDIRGFTTISEKLSPDDVVDLLSMFYRLMTEAILRHNGSVNQFIGDEIFAVFGAPVTDKNFELNAVLAALDMREQRALINEAFSERIGGPINIGIGINTGEVIAGNMGSHARISYTVVGDVVNTAKRIETLSAPYPNSIMIRDHIYNNIRNHIRATPLEPVFVKGKREPIVVFEVHGMKESISDMA